MTFGEGASRHAQATYGDVNSLNEAQHLYWLRLGLMSWFWLCSSVLAIFRRESLQGTLWLEKKDVAECSNWPQDCNTKYAFDEWRVSQDDNKQCGQSSQVAERWRRLGGILVRSTPRLFPDIVPPRAPAWRELSLLSRLSFKRVLHFLGE